MVEKNTRVSVSIRTDLLHEFDAVSDRDGYDNRSNAVAAALSEFIAQRRLLDETHAEVTGAILLTYDHDVRGINDAMTEIQHDHGHEISATMHLHLNHHVCLEIIAVRGSAQKIKALMADLSKKRGVFNAKLVTAYSK